jgi:putative transposase
MVLNRFGQIAKTQWERLPRRFHHVALGEFVVMPNHIHGIIFIADDGRGIGDGRGTAENG